MPRPHCGKFVMASAAMLVTAICGLPAQASPPVAAAQSNSSAGHSAQRISPTVKAPIDRSGEKRIGKASFYAHMFAGRKMADGKQMDPQHDNAASRTLPLGTTAKVTNLETGKSAFVTI